MSSRLKIKAFILLFSLVFHSISHGQQDSVVYTPGLKMNDGIYLSYLDFRKNKTVSKEQIISDMDKNQQEFISKVMFQEKFSYKEKDEVLTKDTKSCWGFFQNNTFYVNYKNDFYRVPVFGAISYLVANVTVVTTGFYDPRFGYIGGSTTSKEIREFIIDFYNGEVVEFSMDRAEDMLSRDKILFDEYKKLSRRKQKEQIYRYIRKYNELHPVYFLNSLR
jgi:hypothetical protein